MTHSVNFLEHLEQPSQQRTHKHRRVWLIVFSLLGSILFLAVLFFVLVCGQVLVAAFDGKDRLVAVQEAVVHQDFEQAQHELVVAQEDFDQAERGWQRLRWLRSFGWVGVQWEAVQTMIHAGNHLVTAAEDVVNFGAELMRLSGVTAEQLSSIRPDIGAESTYDQLSAKTKRALLQRLAGGAPDLSVTAAKIDVALAELDLLFTKDLATPLSTALKIMKDRVEPLANAVKTASVFASLIPAYAGLDHPVNLLVLFENNNELRPGGGFIGTFGVLQIQDGEIRSFVTKDVYALDDPADPQYEAMPPEPLRRYNASGDWFFRDSNWSPDFSVSARQALAIFEQENRVLPEEMRVQFGFPETFDGVIAFTPTFAAELLRLLGPVEMGGQIFTSENIAETLEYQVQFGFSKAGIPEPQRKDILVGLIEKVRYRFMNLPAKEWSKFLDVFSEAIQKKHMAFFHTDSEIQERLIHAGWAGNITPSDGDHLMVVDANLASLKSDPAVQRTIFYSIRPSSDGEYVAQVTIRYEHKGNFDWKTTRYRTYTRVYTPLGSRLLRASGMFIDDALKDPNRNPGSVDMGEELGFQVFGAFTSVEPGQTQELHFEYLLPSSIKEIIQKNQYHLKVYKQIGALSHALTLDLDFDKTLKHALPEEEMKEWNDDVYRLNTKLDQDRTFEVNF